MAASAADIQKDFYCQVLGLNPDPSQHDVRSAYKALVLRWHPDRHRTNKEHAKDKFIEIHTAYQALLSMYPNYTPGSPSGSASSFDSSRASTFYSQSAHGSQSSQTSFTPSSPENAPSHASCKDDLNEPKAESNGHKSKRSRDKENRRRSGGNHHSEGKDRSHGSNHSEGSRQSDGHRPEKAARHSEKADHHSEKSDHHSRSSNSHQKKSSKHHHHEHHERHDNTHEHPSVVVDEEEPELRPPTIGIPLRASRVSGTDDWVFPLPLTLEELHSGTSYHFQITRQLHQSPNSSSESLPSSPDLSPSTIVHIDLEIPPGGYKTGTTIRYEGIGNQRKSDGSFQDIVFIVQEIVHDRFARIRDDLVARIELTWDEWLCKDDVIFIEGLDGENIAVPVPASPGTDKETRVPKAGMPIRNPEGRTIGRGDLVVKWDFVLSDHEKRSPKSKWQAFKSAFTWQQRKPVF